MYSLTCTDAYQYANPGEVYVLDILPTNAGLAAISSDQNLSLFNAKELKRGPVRTFTTSHGNITALRASEPMSPVVLTAGENGSVSVWDLRDPATSSSSAAVSCDASILSLASDARSHSIAVGTEYANHQSSVLTQPRDARELSQPKVQYNEVHSDDITELNFSPANPNLLLSGSTDGLVNICDIRIADEDEVIVQTFNHGASIHRAGFLNQTEVFALSNDEKLALYDMAEQQEKGSATLDFSDMRSVIQCQYVASVHPKGPSAAVIGAGAQDEHRFQLIHLSKTPGWGLDSDNVVNLPGAHGEEVVRSFCVFDDEQVVYTGGEDGQIKAWRPTS